VTMKSTPRRRELPGSGGEGRFEISYRGCPLKLG
jgi:hypothetical protein